jgi:tRNA A22 N-methylase
MAFLDVDVAGMCRHRNGSAIRVAQANSLPDLEQEVAGCLLIAGVGTANLLA